MAHGGQRMSFSLVSEQIRETVKAEDSLERALRIFLGWAPYILLSTPGQSPPVSKGASGVVILQSCARAVRKRLASEGYLHQRRFAVLPSRKNARWLLPLSSEAGALNGFELYKPFSNYGRLMKVLVLLIRATGWEGWIQHEVLLASRSPLSIEQFVSDVLGENDFILTLSLGTPGRFQKLTVQVMRPDGTILGYLKLPLTDMAGDRLSNEAEFLKQLSEFPSMRPHIPRLFFGGPWNGSNLLFESALKGSTGPVHLTKIHNDFLDKLHGCCTTAHPGHNLVQRTGRKWESIAPQMTTEWQGLGREALRIAARELNDSLVPCGVHHGDFTPWNSLVHQGHLLVFDWEAAAWGEPTLWDQFHFIAQTECLLNANHETSCGAGLREKHRALYLLYLLHSTAQSIREKAEKQTIDYREKQMLRYVSGSCAA